MRQWHLWLKTKCHEINVTFDESHEDEEISGHWYIQPAEALVNWRQITDEAITNYI